MRYLALVYLGMCLGLGMWYTYWSVSAVQLFLSTHRQETSLASKFVEQSHAPSHLMSLRGEVFGISKGVDVPFSISMLHERFRKQQKGCVSRLCRKYRKVGKKCKCFAKFRKVRAPGHVTHPRRR